MQRWARRRLQVAWSSGSPAGRRAAAHRSRRRRGRAAGRADRADRARLPDARAGARSTRRSRSCSGARPRPRPSASARRSPPIASSCRTTRATRWPAIRRATSPLVEFFDYQCAYCRQVVPSVRELLEEDQKLKVVFKEFPILGEASVVAARAALAARAQDRYLPFHLALMGSRDLSLDGIMALAEQVGLDTERLAAGHARPGDRPQLQANFALAQKLGIEGTPAFVIGDELIPGAVEKAAPRRADRGGARQLPDLLTAGARPAAAQPGGRLRASVRPSPIGTSARLIRGRRAAWRSARAGSRSGGRGWRGRRPRRPTARCRSGSGRPAATSDQAALVVGVVALLVGVDEGSDRSCRRRPPRAAGRGSSSARPKRTSILASTPGLAPGAAADAGPVRIDVEGQRPGRPAAAPAPSRACRSR